MFLDGVGVPRDPGKAAELLERGAKHGDALAEDYLGILAEYGFSGDANKSEAYKHYVNAAQRGSAWGNLNLGRLYRNAIGVEKNSAEAIKWLVRAASTNAPELLYEWGELRSEASAVADAMQTVGQMYESGTGIPKDMSEATKWYQRRNTFQGAAANAGWPQAQVNVGHSFLGSSSVPRDLPEAKQWFSKAAEQGNRAAEIQLGLLCLAARGACSGFPARRAT
jgi:TPR repeat protein